ncbi:MAG: amino acid ABC transporter permease [Desulfobacterales bacterium]|jgi:polar amino acid transport system permease protein
MKPSKNQRTVARPQSYYAWVGVFCVFALVVMGLFYYATQKIEYVWRWNRVPIYFAYKDTIEITSEIDGDVASITKEGDTATITVKGLDESVSFEVPAAGVSVEEGEMISIGDMLGSYTQWKPGLLILGLWLTLKISVLATILGVIIGIIGGLTRLSGNPALKWTTIVYVEVIRGSPLLVQILIWYFILGTVFNELLAAYGLGRIPAWWYGVASLACFAGAYVTEIVRAGIQSIHRGQMEAARSLGMSYGQAMRYIIMPQALRRILPPLAGQFISLIKDSSLLGIIAIRELTKAAREAVTASLQPFEVFMLCAVLYLVLTFTLSMLVQHLERRMAIS